MAGDTSSPIINNNGSEANSPISTAAVKSPSTVFQRSELTSKNLRGLNKPKCINCGNVARSRCPFKCCKSCCFKAQNPCGIHVLKPNSTLADRGGTGNAAAPEQQPSEALISGPPAKVSSIRQLSVNFSQFNNVHIPLRSRKPLSLKEALVINEWRFSKLKEYKQRNIEAENEAFDRYMHNISLLEEVFDANSDMQKEEDSQISNLPTISDEKTKLVAEMKAKLRSNPVRIDNFRKRIRQTVDQGLRNLQSYDSNHLSANLDNEDDPTPKVTKNWWGGKTSALTELNDKLNRAKNKDDLEACFELRAKIRGQAKTTPRKNESSEKSKEQTMAVDMGVSRESEKPLLKFVRATEIDQDTLNGMEFYFSSLEEIEDL